MPPFHGDEEATRRYRRRGGGEVGEPPPEIASLPIGWPALQLNPATNWMYTADRGKAGPGLNGRSLLMPRGKMLGGSAGINYMLYMRGHPSDFAAWRRVARPAGATSRCCLISASPLSRRSFSGKVFAAGTLFVRARSIPRPPLRDAVPKARPGAA